MAKRKAAKRSKAQADRDVRALERASGIKATKSDRRKAGGNTRKP